MYVERACLCVCMLWMISVCMCVHVSVRVCILGVVTVCALFVFVHVVHVVCVCACACLWCVCVHACTCKATHPGRALSSGLEEGGPERISPQRMKKQKPLQPPCPEGAAVTTHRVPPCGLQTRAYTGRCLCLALFVSRAVHSTRAHVFSTNTVWSVFLRLAPC